MLRIFFIVNAKFKRLRNKFVWDDETN